MSIDPIVTRLLAAVPAEGRALVAIDDFFHPSAVRYARGRHSPEGFWLDAYDHDALVTGTLTPLAVGGSGLYRTASFDPAADATLELDPVAAQLDAIVLVEGTFLHRDELRRLWDFSIYLDVPFEEASRRMVRRDGEHRPTDRYVGGQRLYFAAASPWDRASLVVDNADVDDPRVIDAATARDRILREGLADVAVPRVLRED